MSPYWIFVAGLLTLHHGARPEAEQVSLQLHAGSSFVETNVTSGRVIDDPRVDVESGRERGEVTSHETHNREWASLKTVNFYKVDNGDPEHGGLELAEPTAYTDKDRYFKDLMHLKHELDPNIGQVGIMIHQDEYDKKNAERALQNWLDEARHQRINGNKEFHEAMKKSMDRIRKEKDVMVKFMESHKLDGRDDSGIEVPSAEAPPLLKCSDLKQQLEDAGTCSEHGVNEGKEFQEPVPEEGAHPCCNTA